MDHIVAIQQKQEKEEEQNRLEHEKLIEERNAFQQKIQEAKKKVLIFVLAHLTFTGEFRPSTNANPD